MKKSDHAAVLNIVSVGAFGFAADLSMYAAGKAALMSYTRSMAAAFVGDGIRVNAIAPGPVDTDMMRNNPQEAIDGMTRGTLMKRLGGTPDELVGAALLLCSDAGSYMTGTMIIVDGGGTPPLTGPPSSARACVSARHTPGESRTLRTLVGRLKPLCYLGVVCPLGQLTACSRRGRSHRRSGFPPSCDRPSRCALRISPAEGGVPVPFLRPSHGNVRLAELSVEG